MAEVKNWLAGFVYRARAPWEQEPPAYHIEIGEYVEVEGRAPVLMGEPQILTPDQAKAAGYDLPAALAEIDATALAELQDLRAKTASLATELQAANDRAASLSGALEDAQAQVALLTSRQTARAMDDASAPTDSAS